MDEEAHQLNALAQAARLGDEVEREVANSKIIKLILSRAQSEKREAEIELGTKVDPSDTKRIIELQSVIHRSNSIGHWIQEAIQRGQQAAEQIADATHLEPAEGEDIAPGDQQQS